MDGLSIVRDLRLPGDRRFGDVMAGFQASDFERVLGPHAPPNQWISRPRGGSKTSDTAALAIVDLLTAPDRSQLFAAAVDRDQARLLHESIVRWHDETPDLRGSLAFTNDTVVNPVTGTRLRVLSNDAPSALGLLPFRIYCDELAAWPDDRLWTSLISASHKVPGSRVFVLTTAGSPTSWAFKVWEHASGSKLWQVLHTDELAPWTDSAQLEDARAHLPASMAARYFENRWVAGDEALFTAADIDGATDHDREPAVHGDGNSSYFIGVDFGRVNDRTAIAVVRRDHKNHRHELVNLWVRRGSKAAPVLVSELEERIGDLRRRFPSAVIYADPWQLVGTSERMGIREYPFTAPSVAALSTGLLSLIREGRLRLLPDPDLRTELLSMIVKETSYGWRMDHPPGGHDDRVMAIALAAIHANRPPDTAWAVELDTSSSGWLAPGEGGNRSEESAALARRIMGF